MSETGLILRRNNAPIAAAAAISVVLGAESMRVLISLLYGLREEKGSIAAALVAVVVFLATFVAGPIRRAAGARIAIAGALGLQAILQVVIQVVHPIPIVLPALAVVFALISWTLLLHAFRAKGSEQGAIFALAVVLGLILDTAIDGLFVTWGYSWQTGLPPVIAAILLSLALLAVIPGTVKDLEPAGCELTFGQTFALVALGPFIFLQIQFLQNIAFADSAAGLSLPAGIAVILAGELFAIVLMIVNLGSANTGALIRGLLGIALIVLAWFVTDLHGPAVAVVLVLASAITGPLLASALSRGGAPFKASTWRTSVAVGIGSLIFVMVSFAYQIDITNPLPFSNRILAPGCALILAIAAVGKNPSEVRVPKGLIAVPLAFLIVIPVGIALTTPASALIQGDGRSLRVMSWNIHSAIAADGMLDPPGLAAQIRAANPDVVVMQEIARGWTIAGTTDEAAWLARDLGFEFAWAGAADGQFGNLLLSRYPIVSAQAVPLPFGDGPQHRSFVKGVISIGGGTEVTVLGAHLESTTPKTHADQVIYMLADVAGAPRTIIAGDMNMQPTNADRLLFAKAGYHSAQDSTGHGSESSALSPNFPGDRPDWIFGTEAVMFTDFQIGYSIASDHLPLITKATIK